MDQKTRVLVIDDDLSVGKFLKRKLEKTEKYSVFHVDNKEEGFSQAKIEKPDIIILDIDLADDCGGDVGYELTEDPETRGIPFLFFSSMISEAEVANRNGKLGKYTIVSKASKLSELIRNMEDVLARSRM